MLEGHRRGVEKHWEGEKREGKNPQTPTMQQDESVGESQTCSLSRAVPYKEENHCQRKAEAVGKACATQMYPQRVSLVTCPCTHHGSMFHSMYICSVFLPGGHASIHPEEQHVGPGLTPRPPHAASCFQS